MCCISQDVFLRFADFTTSTSLESKFLKGRRFRLLMDRHIVLEEGVEWICKPLGGFDLQGGLSVGVDTVVVVQFY